MPPNDDAIQQDVSSEQKPAADATITEAETTAPPKSEREIAIEAMEARRREELAADGVALGGAAEIDTDAQIEQQTAVAEEAKDKAEEEPAIVDTPMVKVKVNGVEEMVPLEKVVARYQKSEAADKRLEEATRLLEEAQARANAATTLKEKAEASAVADAAADDLAALKKKFSDSIFAGEADQAETALEEIVNQSVAKALKGRENATSDEALIARVAPAVKQSIEFESALGQFKKDYPAIAKDLHLASRADVFLNEAVAAGKAYDAAFKEAGEKTLGWMRESLGIKSEVTVSTTRSERTERKAAEIDSVPTASAKTVLADAPTEQNVSQSIAEMRKARVVS